MNVKNLLFAITLLMGYSLYSQQLVGLTDNTNGSFLNLGADIVGSPALNGHIDVGFKDNLGIRRFLATPINTPDDDPMFRSIDALDLPVADNTSQAGIVSTTTQIFGGAKTFSSSVAISGSSGNSLAIETSGFVYDATNNRIGINTATPTYFFDLKAPSPTITYYTHRNSEGNESLLLDFSSDNIRFGLIDSTGLTTVKLRSNSVSFIQNHFMVGDNANDDDNPQFKVVGTQDYSEGNTSWVNYQSTVQNHTDTNGESASIGFGVDSTKTVIGGYISFVRTANPSKGGLHFGVYNSALTSIEDVMKLEAGRISIKAGASSDLTAKVGGTTDVYSSTSGVGNTAATETSLYTRTITANTLSTNGDRIVFEASGTFANTASTDKQVLVKYGATTIFNSNALNITTTQYWSIHGVITRTGATTQKCTVDFISSDAALRSSTFYITAAETLSGNVTLDIRGKGTNANDVVFQMGSIEWKSAQ